MADTNSTTKKKWLLIIILVVIVLGSIFLYFLFSGGGSGTDGDSVEDTDSSIFPFSTSSEGFFGSDDEGDEEDDVEPDPVTIPRLEKISDAPVAGSGWITVSTSSTATTSGDQTKELVRFVRTENGHIYQYDPEERTKERITNTTIPQVKDAIFSPDGTNVVFQYYSNDTNSIKTYLAEISTSSTSSSQYTLEGNFLPDDITNISFSPEGGNIFYTLLIDGRTYGYITPTDLSNRREVFSSDVTSWQMQWDAAEKITAYTNPSSSSQGYVYLINTSDGSFDRLTGGQAALTAQANQASNVLTTSDEGTHVYSTDNSETSVSIDTIADFKCGWRDSTSVAYCGVPKNGSGNLDAWLQGRTSYNDILYSVVSNNGNVNQLIDLSDVSGEPVDVIDLHQNGSGSHTVFKNRLDNYLWLFRRDQ